MTDLTIKSLTNTDVVLKKINQDAYSGEYFKRDGTTEYRVKTRHTNESPKAGALPMVRHNVDITVTTFPSDGGPNSVVQAYMVLRYPLGGSDTAMGYIINDLLDVVGDNKSGILGWETDLANVS